MLRDNPFVKDEMYHLYARGIEKRPIFLSDFSYKRFQLSLYLSNDRYGKVETRNLLKVFGKDERPDFRRIYQEYDRGEPFVDILAYALMPNHFHLLVRELQPEGGGVSKFMQKVMNSHTGYFNKANDRKGSLFEGTFRSKHVDTESYYRWLFSYIHLNPLKLVDSGWRDMKINDFSSARDFLNTYQYSSFLDYAGRERPEGNIVNMENLPEYFAPARDVDGLIAERHENIPLDPRKTRFA
jgi:putative transposase